jgi:hypothetical protein
MVTPRGVLSLGCAAGYRWARIGGIKFAGSTSDLSADYSGWFVRVGLALDGRAGN